MKTIITIALTLIIALPLFSLADNLGMKSYQHLKTAAGIVVKIYDHDEGVLCYVMDGPYSGGISCIKD